MVHKIPSEGLPANVLEQSIVEQQLFDHDEEVEVGKLMDKNFTVLETLRKNQIEKHAELEVAYFDRFAVIRRDIDLRGELFKEKIDLIVQEMTKKANDKEQDFKEKLLKIAPSSIEKERRLANASQPFRNPELICKSIAVLNREQKNKVSQIRSSFNSFSLMNSELNDMKFEAQQKNSPSIIKDRAGEFFGKLIL